MSAGGGAVVDEEASVGSSWTSTVAEAVAATDWGTDGSAARTGVEDANASDFWALLRRPCPNLSAKAHNCATAKRKKTMPTKTSMTLGLAFNKKRTPRGCTAADTEPTRIPYKRTGLVKIRVITCLISVHDISENKKRHRKTERQNGKQR